MPKKAPPATDWQPLDLLEEGRAIYAALPTRKIQEILAASLPNWKVLDDGGRSAARTVVFDAFLFLFKDRADHHGFPRVATVKAHLGRIGAALVELCAAFDALDMRTGTAFKRAAGAEVKKYNYTPLNESPMPGGAFDRGHHRVELLKKALADAQRWTADALRETPRQDSRKSDEPGLNGFANSIAHVWETYGGVRFTASRNRDGAPDFIVKILEAGGVPCTRAKALKAADAVARDLERKHADRIIVPPEDRLISLAELGRRKPPPKKGKRSATG